MGLYKNISMIFTKDDKTHDDLVEHNIERFSEWVQRINSNKLPQNVIDDLNMRFYHIDIPDKVMQEELKNEREYFYAHILDNMMGYTNYGVTSKYELLGRINFILVKIRNMEDTDLEFLFLLMIMFSSIRNKCELELRKHSYDIVSKYYPDRIGKDDMLKAAEGKLFSLDDILEMYE